MRSTTMIGDIGSDSTDAREKSMRAELKGERFVTHVNLSDATATMTVSHCINNSSNESESVAINMYMEEIYLYEK